MVTPSLRQTILEMNKRGVGLREISRILQVSRNTVRQVVRGKKQGQSRKPSKHDNHLPVIRELFRECRGNVVRVQEELEERHDIIIPYQTLTWLVRKHEIRAVKQKERAGEYTFAPGEEMQHDTSPHSVKLGGKKVSAQCASLVLAYSRKLFIQYYPCFTRFECKVFLSKAFEFMDGGCPRCIIDNTSVIVASGSGPDAVIAPEMEYWGGIYGVKFVPHFINDPDRKARVERNFHYAENNFLAGRDFADWQDLNNQAESWCGKKANRKRKRSLGMSPDGAYIIEKPALLLLPPFSPPVYQCEYRTVDIQGYVHLDTNRYSVPHTHIGEKLEVQKHWEQVIIYNKQKKVAEHDRIIDKRDTRVTAPGHHPPLSGKKTYQGPCREEKLLRNNDKSLDYYVAELKKRSHGRGVAKLRRLLNLKRTYPQKPFLAAVGQALKYGLYDLTRLEKIILGNIAGDFFDLT